TEKLLSIEIKDRPRLAKQIYLCFRVFLLQVSPEKPHFSENMKILENIVLSLKNDIKNINRENNNFNNIAEKLKFVDLFANLYPDKFFPFFWCFSANEFNHEKLVFTPCLNFLLQNSFGDSNGDMDIADFHLTGTDFKLVNVAKARAQTKFDLKNGDILETKKKRPIMAEFEENYRNRFFEKREQIENFSSQFSERFLGDLSKKVDFDFVENWL
ncbi:hypothetical protein MHBO_004754, partial [Bonamia ostreae]